MMLGETPTVDQRRPSASALSIITRVTAAGAVLRRQDAHLEVDEPHVLELGIDRDQRLAQRGVERVHRAVALGHFHDRACRATSTLTVASDRVISSPRAFQRRSSRTRKLCSAK